MTSEDARAVEVDPTQLRLMHQRGTLERLAQGLYRFPTVPTTALDQYMEATLWPRTSAVLSHETALDLHELCDVNPARIHLTVPPDYRLRRALAPAYQLHPRALVPADITQHEGIDIVTARRAILDGIEGRLGGQLIDQAVTIATSRGLLSPAEVREITSARLASPLSREVAR